MSPAAIRSTVRRIIRAFESGESMMGIALRLNANLAEVEAVIRREFIRRTTKRKQT